jgi:hypothetical protein
MFKESNGKISVMRLMSVLCVISGIVYGFVTKDPVITGMLLGYGFGGKLVQKKLETK